MSTDTTEPVLLVSADSKSITMLYRQADQNAADMLAYKIQLEQVTKERDEYKRLFEVTIIQRANDLGSHHDVVLDARIEELTWAEQHHSANLSVINRRELWARIAELKQAQKVKVV
jgi:hypothetical protein